MVGNKLDLVEENNSEDNIEDNDNDSTNAGVRQVSYEEASAYASEAGLLFFETSARTALNVDEVFTEIGKILRQSIYNHMTY